MSEQQQYPTREQIAEALNTAWRKHIVGQVPRHSLGPSAQDFVAGWESAVCALLPQPAPSAEHESEQYATTTEYAYGTLDAPDIIVPTGEDIDDLGTARYNADEFWIDVLQRTVKRGPWQVVPSEVDPTPGAES